MGVSQSENGMLYSDGQIIFLPPGDSQQLLVGLVVQAALLAGGGFDRRIVLQLMGRGSIARRYLTLEADRMGHLLAECLPTSIHVQMITQWQGTTTLNPQESLRRALGREAVPDAPDAFGVIRPRQLLKGVTSGGGPALSEEDLRRARRRMANHDLDDMEEEQSDPSVLLKLMAGVVGGDSPFSKFLRNVLGVGRSPDSGEQGGSESGDAAVGGARRADKVGPSAKMVSGISPGQHGQDNNPIGGMLYPEWDWRRSAYRPRWCAVSHYDPAAVEGTERLSEVPDSRLLHKFARIGMAHQRHGREVDGDDLDLAALVDFAVESASGRSGDARVYETRRKTRRDLGVILLLDASGSTDEHRVGGASVWDAQRILAQSMAAALEKVGDRVALYGFRSFGRNDVRFLRIKEFDGRFDQGARKRLRALQPLGYTRLGAAIRHGTRLAMEKAGATSRLLIVISDGFPYDDDYEASYAEQDSRHALGEAEALGVGCVCLSVGSSTDPVVLERVWGNVGHASLDSPRDLGDFIEPLFRSAIRRVTIRTEDTKRAQRVRGRNPRAANAGRKQAPGL